MCTRTIASRDSTRTVLPRPFPRFISATIRRRAFCFSVALVLFIAAHRYADYPCCHRRIYRLFYRNLFIEKQLFVDMCDKKSAQPIFVLQTYEVSPSHVTTIVGLLFIRCNFYMVYTVIMSKANYIWYCMLVDTLDTRLSVKRIVC